MHRYTKLTILLGFLLAGGCRDSAFLDQKPDMGLVIPQSLDELLAILDNDKVMNGSGSEGLQPALGEASADDFTIAPDKYNSLKSFATKLYTWADPLRGETSEIKDWSLPYKSVFYANLVLDGLRNITPRPDEQPLWNSLKGSALFYRAYQFYHLAQVFAPFYDPNETAEELGIPLRLQSDINEPLPRASLKATYAQIFQDLGEADGLLPDIPAYATRPGRVAVQGLLARIYISMANYDQALQAADKALAITSELMDFNELDSALRFPVQRFGKEVIFQCNLTFRNTTTNENLVAYTLSSADTALFRSYSPDDLRKRIYFAPTGATYFMGSYSGTQYLFGGLATDELMLIRAECLARQGDIKEALHALNSLLVSRYKKGRFVPYEEHDPQKTLALILTERRKELTMRGIRWSDLRRLNREPVFAKTLTRWFNGKQYSLPPNDGRYVFPVPEKVSNLNPLIDPHEK